MRFSWLVALLVALAIVATGCGSSGSTTAGSTPAPSSRTQFRACMQKQGVTPLNGRPQAGQRDAKTQRAFQACRQYLPQAGRFGGSGA